MRLARVVGLALIPVEKLLLGDVDFLAVHLDGVDQFSFAIVRVLGLIDLVSVSSLDGFFIVGLVVDFLYSFRLYRLGLSGFINGFR